ncbi:MAG: hypothetical protein O7D91_01070, partial [Planctomycetota bacterium]|nr:hypothetical protein [Planctomycetota bacterium]
ENEAGIECTFCPNCCDDDDDCDCGEECIEGMCVVSGNDCDENGTPDECEELVCPSAGSQKSQSNVSTGDPGGTVFLSGDDADDDNHCHGTLCAGLWPDLLEFAVDHSLTGPGGDGLICAVGVNSGPALVALQGADGTGGWNNTGDVDHPGPDADIVHFRFVADIETFDLSPCTVLYIPSGSLQTVGGITVSQLAALNMRMDEVVNFVNVQGGALVALTQAEMPGAYGWLPLEIQTDDEEHFMATVTEAMQELFPDITDDDVSRPPGDAAPRYHTIFTGPEGFLGLEVLIREDDPDESDGAPLMLGGFQVVIDGQLILTPDSATNFLPQDDTHTVTATLVEAEPPFDPISGAMIEFVIESGPNMGVVGTCSANADCTTGTNGKVSFTYTSNGIYSLEPDVIRARWEAGDDEDAVEKLWLPCHCEDAEPATGACCDGETCSVTTESDCVDGGGVYQDDDSVCDPNPCELEPATGACCDGETCSVTMEADCVDGGGEYQGDDEGCDPNPCVVCGPGNGDCCIPNGTPGCDDEACCNTVCAQDPFCCDPDSFWDSVCVNQAVALCGDLCEAPAEGACCDGETCSVTTEADCIDGGGEYQGDEEVCSPNPCAPSESDCCCNNGTPGCDDEACEAIVCGVDPFCCSDVWDEICVEGAIELCDDVCGPEPGDCPGPDNNDCDNSIEIFDGVTEFDTTIASTDGLAHPDVPCQFDGQTYHDIWYDYLASCTGNLTVTTCEQLGGSADYDTDLVVYDGCDICLPGDDLVLGCNDDDPNNPCGNDLNGPFHSTVVVSVDSGNCYKIRIGGWQSGSVGTGNVFIACQP